MTKSPRISVEIGRIGAGLAAAAALGLCAAASAKAPRTEGGRTLVVPEEHAEMGEVFYVHPGRDAQAMFTSDAPLEHIKGTSNEIVGYAIWDESESLLAAGEFHLPVASIKTGIPMRDEHLQGGRWLDAESYPDIVFELTLSKDSRVARETEEFATYEMTLVGDMTIKGVTRELEIPATVTIMPESERTRTRARRGGDLMRLSCEYEIKLADYGIDDQAIGIGKVAEVVELENVLFLGTVSPDR